MKIVKKNCLFIALLASILSISTSLSTAGKGGLLYAKTSAAKSSSVKSNSAQQQVAPSEELFMKKLGDKVQAQLNANRPQNLKSATQAVLLIKMNATGAVEEVKIDTSSGISEVDQAALMAVKKAAPFGKIPTKFKDGLALKYTFNFGPSKPEPLSVDEKADSDAYMRKVREKISNSWRSPDVKTKCKTTIYFLIEATGKIKTASLKKTSGIKAVDEAALAAIKRAGPFEPLPAAWKNGYGVEYTLAAGPKSDIEHYKFNDVSLPDGDYQISRSGAKLHPLEYNKKIENQLQNKRWAAEDKLKSLQTKLESASTPQMKSELLVEMGRTSLSLHKFEQAILSFSEACKTESEIDSSSVKYALVLKELAEAQRQNNELDNACQSYQKSIEILKSKSTESDTNSKELKDCMTGYAKTLYKQNKIKEGDAIYAEIKALK
ncbi:MAG: TonB family protein [Candidatus Melainabacteria bacterium]|nr:TonB family protein [Candidatus Melainabacteria bacterium]